MGMSPLQHTMLKLPFLLVLLVVGQNHAKLSSIGKQKLMEYRTMLEAAEKEDLGDAADVGNAGIKNAATAAEGKDPPDLDNTAGDQTKVDFHSDAGNVGIGNAAEGTAPPDSD